MCAAMGSQIVTLAQSGATSAADSPKASYVRVRRSTNVSRQERRRLAVVFSGISVTSHWRSASTIALPHERATVSSSRIPVSESTRVHPLQMASTKSVTA
jgi:hypothetical protein